MVVNGTLFLSTGISHYCTTNSSRRLHPQDHRLFPLCSFAVSGTAHTFTRTIGCTLPVHCSVVQWSLLYSSRVLYGKAHTVTRYSVCVFQLPAETSEYRPGDRVCVRAFSVTENSQQTTTTHSWVCPLTLLSCRSLGDQSHFFLFFHYCSYCHSLTHYYCRTIC